MSSQFEAAGTASLVTARPTEDWSWTCPRCARCTSTRSGGSRGPRPGSPPANTPQQAARHGLTTGFGDTGSVGIAGLTLGGGIGWLVRKHGLTIDDLLAVELVTADGERHHVDFERHPDLFWALRGGGGNFGVVTRLEYRLHEIDTVLGGMLVLPASPGIVGSFIAVADDAPDELSTIAILARLPPLPFVSEEHHGQLALMVRVAYAGHLEHGQQALAPLRALATPLADAITPMPYQQLYPAEGPGLGRLRRATRSMFIDHFD